MNLLTTSQMGHNRSTRAAWTTFTGHREQITALLHGSASRQARLCVLGAGNCNDLDLHALTSSHREVVLVDLDAVALTTGVDRQGLADSSAVHRYGNIDLTGALDKIAAWSPAAIIQGADLEGCVAEPVRRVASLLPGPFDVVASTCVLSQLMDTAVKAIGEQHPRFLDVLQSVRLGHLRLLHHLTAPGGVAVLITDIVSSDTFPSLGAVPDETFPAVLRQLIQERNFFHGVNPAVLLSLYRNDPVLCADTTAVETIRPWRWNLGPRLYAVCAFKVRKRPR